MKIKLNRIFDALLVTVLFVASGTVCTAHIGHHDTAPDQTKSEATTSEGSGMPV